MFTVDLIGGARPNFVKLASIVKAIKKAKKSGGLIDYRFIHTGQHYSPLMSGDFFTQLNIPKPDINLEVGSGTQAEQTAKIMTRYEKVLLEKKSDLCLVVGDVTSTMACAIVARKLGVPVAHVEAGIRSLDWSMPEEINRVVTDSITNWFFTTSEYANQNLQLMGVDESRIFFVGNTMIDTLISQLPNLSQPDLWQDLQLSPKEYLMLTLHRPSNVDEPKHLQQILSTIEKNCRAMPIVFPVHPRTEKILESLGEKFSDIYCVPPQGYLEFNYLMKNSFGMITDSGGITEETTVLNVPCLTLRENTERPETVSVGTNELVGVDPIKITEAMNKLLDGKWKTGGVPDKWDGLAGKRIVEQLETLLGEGS